MTQISLGAAYYSGCKLSLSEFLEVCTQAGLEVVEIHMEHPYSPERLTGDEIERLDDLLSSYNLKPLLHGSFHDVNLASLKDEIRKASVTIITKCLHIASKMNVERLTIHCGKCPKDQAALVGQARKRMLASLYELGSVADELGVQLGIENKQKGSDIELVMFPEEQLDIVNRLKEYGAVAVLDLGHANTTGKNLIQYLETLQNVLKEVHVHDNLGNADEHLPLGKGTLPIMTIMKRLRQMFRGEIIIEDKDVTAIFQDASQLRTLHLSSYESPSINY